MVYLTHGNENATEGSWGHEMNGYTNKKENGKRYDKDEKKQYEYGSLHRIQM